MSEGEIRKIDLFKKEIEEEDLQLADPEPLPSVDLTRLAGDWYADYSDAAILINFTCNYYTIEFLNDE